jgi:hypothetical protein
MNDAGLTNGGRFPTKAGMRSIVAMALLGASGMLGGCVTVNAPTKPIQIDLNINVTQQVVYRLDSEAKSVIQSNPGIF